MEHKGGGVALGGDGGNSNNPPCSGGCLGPDRRRGRSQIGWDNEGGVGGNKGD